LHQDNDFYEKLLLNCPARKFVDTRCKTVTDFRRDLTFESRFDHAPPSVFEEPDRVIQLKMNFAVGSGINGIEFKHPEEPFFDGPENTPMTKCSSEQLEAGGGHCTQIIEIKKDEFVEFRLNYFKILKFYQT
jgi:hypothetical protein